MDLGKFQPFVSELSDDSVDQSAAKWRLPPEESFSDWTVEILVAPTELNAQDLVPSDVSQEKQSSSGAIYHVHKERLGTGPRRSLYFAKVFRSQFSETSNQKSTLHLPQTAAECFPDLLDFVYSESSNVMVDSPASAAAIRYLAHYFGIEELYNNVNATFISNNMSNGTVLDYVHESIRYGDDSLGKAAHQYLIKAISNDTLQWTEAMASLPLSSFLEVGDKAKDNETFGRIIIEYINSDEQRVSSDHVGKLLDNLCPHFIEECAFEILQVAERYQLPANHCIRRNCADAIGKTWSTPPFLRGINNSSGASVKASRDRYNSLSDAQKVQILETSLRYAHLDCLTGEAERAKFARVSDPLCTTNLKFYDGINPSTKPFVMPKKRHAEKEFGAVLCVTTAPHYCVRNFPLYMYKG